MSVELYIDYFSQPSRTVLAFCIEAEIPVVIKEVRLAKNEQFSEKFLKINPWGTVPSIVHNGHSVSESHSILTYLAEEFQKTEPWYPVSRPIRTKINTYLHWHHQNIRAPFGIYVYNKFMGPRFFGRKFSQEMNDELETDQKVVLPYLDEILAKGFVAETNEVSIADLSLYCELSQCFILNMDFSGYKNISKWMQYMRGLKGIREAHKVFDKLLPKIKL